MGKVIRVDNEVYEWLKSFAVPLKDTPNRVLRRIARLDPPLDPQSVAIIVAAKKKRKEVKKR